MTAQEFETVLSGRLDKIAMVLASKSAEYASPTDRLHNFKRAAQVTGERPEQVCVGFMVKHLVSVLDIVDAVANGVILKADLADEKIGDAINYLILLEALLVERVKGG